MIGFVELLSLGKGRGAAFCKPKPAHRFPFENRLRGSSVVWLTLISPLMPNALVMRPTSTNWPCCCCLQRVCVCLVVSVGPRHRWQLLYCVQPNADQTAPLYMLPK